MDPRQILGPSPHGPDPVVVFCVPPGDGREPANLAVHVHRALARLCGAPQDAGFRWPGVRVVPERGRLRATFPYPPFPAGMDVARWIAAGWERGALPPPSPELLDAHRCASETWNAALPLRAAAARAGLAFRLSAAGPVHLVELGAGRGRRRIVHSCLDTSSGAGTYASLNKAVWRARLAALGLPVAPGGEVQTPEAALTLAGELGYPVALKAPRSGNSLAVVAGIAGPEALRRAWAHVRQASDGEALLLERHLPGRTYRAVVVCGRLLRVAEARPRYATGDGRGSCEALLRRHLGSAVDHLVHRRRLRGVLLSQGLDFGDRAPRGRLAITPPSDSWLDVTPRVPRRTRDTLEAVARHLGLDVAGLDFVARRLATPLVEGTGAIVDCNHGPGFVLERDRDRLARLLLVRLYPEGPTEVPVVAITGFDRPGPFLFAARQALRRHGRRIAVAPAPAPRDRHDPALRVLDDPRWDGIVLEISPDGWDRFGLPCDRLDAVVAGPRADPRLVVCLARHLRRGGRLLLPETSELPRLRGLRLARAAPGWNAANWKAAIGALLV